jgi:general secretion pathway protein D
MAGRLKMITDTDRRINRRFSAKIIVGLAVVVLMVVPTYMAKKSFAGNSGSPDLAGAAKTETRTFYLDNTDASKVAETLQKSLGEICPKPDVAVDKATNSLVIIATEDALEQMGTMLDRLDVERPQIMIEAMLVEIARSELAKLRIELQAVTVNAEKHPPVGELLKKFGSLSAEKLQTVKKMMQSGEIESNIVSNPRLMAIDQTQARFNTSAGKISYMEKVSDNLYELKTFDDPGLSFTVTPTITGDSIRMALDLRLSQMEGRAVVPEAPDLRIGLPIMGTRMISTPVIVKNGETAVLGGFCRGRPENEKVDTLLFVTAGVVAK